MRKVASLIPIRLPIKDGLPQYTPEEERFHVLSHLPGIVLGACMVGFALFQCDTLRDLCAGMVFGLALILLYAASCIYHGLPQKRNRLKKIFRIIDHCSIFVLIAGSGTPFILSALWQTDPQAGLFYFLLFWILAVFGSVLLTVNLERFKKISILLYLVMGFSILFKAGPLKAAIGTAGFTLLAAGGVSYCIGLALYSVKLRWTHAAFHVLCVVGSVLHCVCVCTCVFD